MENAQAAARQRHARQQRRWLAEANRRLSNRLLDAPPRSETGLSPDILEAREVGLRRVFAKI